MKSQASSADSAKVTKQSSVSDHPVDPKKEQAKPEQVEQKAEYTRLNTRQPAQQGNPSKQETDEEYAKRVLSSKDYLASLMACAQFPQKCDMLLEIIQQRDSRLFSVSS